VALVLGALGRLRCKLVASEYEIHTAVLEELRREGITRVLHEVKLAGHGRIDFLAQSDGGYGVGIEVKKGKIGSRAIAAQIERYGRDPLVDELVMVIERTVFEPPQVTSTGKRVHYVSLSKNWGVAL
jgi:RecB family endonuclease NucS